LDSRVLCDQELHERTKQRFASLSDIVHRLMLYSRVMDVRIV
jgi:predicted nucleic acid-binding OB-fold protein